MGGENIDLKLIIKALLDSKGFEEAQVQLKRIADSAQNAAPKVDNLGKKFGGSRGPVADMTRVLLQNIGVTGAAGEAAKAAGESVLFFAGAANPAILAATALVAVVAVLAPKIIEAAKGTDDWKKEAEEAARRLQEMRQAIADSLPDLLAYAETIRPVPKYLKEWIEAARQIAMDEQGKRAISLADQIERLTGQYLKDAKQLEEWKGRIAGASAVGFHFQNTVNDLTKSVENQAAAIAVLTKEAEEIAIAENAGIPVAELRRQATVAGTKATHDEAEALREKKRLLAEQLQLERDIARETGRRIQQENKDRSEARKKREQDVETAARRILEIEEEKKARKQETDEAIQSARLKTNTLAQLWTQAIATAVGAFTKNKAINIALAIADTYTAATAALGMKPWTPANFAMAAVVIAQGLANVQQIRKTNVGFDDPFADLVARKMGRKSAEDFARHFGSEFSGRLPGAMAAATNIYNQSTTINRGTSVGSVNYNSIVGARRTQQLKQLNRDLIATQRLEDRTTIGR